MTDESRYKSFVGKNGQVVVGPLKTTTSALSIASMRGQGDRWWASWPHHPGQVRARN